MQIETLRDKYRSVPVDFGTTPVEDVNYWLTRFILEILRGDGKPYPYGALYTHYHTSVTDYHVNAQSDWLHKCRLSIDRRHLDLLKLASPLRFRGFCEEDVQNVLQSVIPWNMPINNFRNKMLYLKQTKLSKKSNNCGSCFVLDWFSTQKEITTPIE